MIGLWNVMLAALTYLWTNDPIIRSLIGSSSRVDYHKPMIELVNDFPKLKGPKVVVAAYDGEEAFTPTELPKTAETLVLNPSEVAR